MTFCKNVAILLQHRARSDAMHKFRRIKMSPCENVPLCKIDPTCKSDPSCKSVTSWKSDPPCNSDAVQKFHLVQKSRRAKVSPRAKGTLRAKVSPRAKVTLVQKCRSCKSDPFPNGGHVVANIFLISSALTLSSSATAILSKLQIKQLFLFFGT